MKTHFGTINCKPSDDIVSDSKTIIGLALKVTQRANMIIYMRFTA